MDLMNKVKEGVQYMLIKFFECKAAWLKVVPHQILLSSDP